MQFIADTHTHTLASGHALSTVIENARQARKKGFRFLVTSDHGSGMSGSAQSVYFDALHSVMPHSFEGVYLLSGCEANIVNMRGELDLPEHILNSLDIVIASFHTLCIQPATKEEHTRCWLSVCDNPSVDIMGHMGDMRFDFDHESVIRRCKETGKVVEINSHSFEARPGSAVSCPDIARLCMAYGVPVVVSSDAHFATSVGHFDEGIAMLREIGFPQELILNADYDRFAAFAAAKTGRSFPLSALE